MSETIRIAVCQIECHPALVVGDRDYLAEPYLVGKHDVCLADISRFALNVSEIQERCRVAYLDWHSKRLAGILTWLTTLNPLPHIVTFPECSIPIHDLHMLREFARDTKAAVFAGTHTFRNIERDAEHYRALGIRGLKESRSRFRSLAGSTILPVFCGDKTHHHVKGLPAAFEHTDASQPVATLRQLEPIELELRDRSLRVLPAICAEALGLSVPAGEYDMVVITAFNDGIAPFQPTITHNIQNQKPVVFCNDGHYGGSSIHVVQDSRMSGIWWWSEPQNGLLPKGDAILVADVHMSKLAAQFGVNNPAPPAQLIRVSSIIARNEAADDFIIASELSRLAEIRDNTVQGRLISGLLKRVSPTPTQRICAQHLGRLCDVGTGTADIWECIGNSCVIDTPSDIRHVEHDEASICLGEIDRLLDATEIEDDRLLGKLSKLKRGCRSRLIGSRGNNTSLNDGPHTAQVLPDVPLDRDDETRTIRAFLDSRGQRLLCVTGLDDVGKHTVVELAIAQAARDNNVFWLELAPDASPEFIVSSLWRFIRRGLPAGATEPTLDSIKEPGFASMVLPGVVVVISNADSLKSKGLWRDPRTSALIADLANALFDRRGKLVVCSSIRIDFDHLKPGDVARLWLRGLPQDHALVLFDLHLRRAGIEPTDYPHETRLAVVQAVGGHPGAMILASEYAGQEGLERVASDLTKRSGLHTEIVRRILHRLSFTEDETTVFALLNETRLPLPATALIRAVPFNPMPVVIELIHKCVVERKSGDHVQVTDLVRGYIDARSVTQKTRQLFHRAAAEAFRHLSGGLQSAEELSLGIEANYHAQLAGDPSLSPQVNGLIDGTVGAIQVLVDQHEYERAKPLVERLLRTNPTPELYQLGAIIFARLGECDEALALAKEAVARDPNRQWILTEVGRLSLHVHRDDVADQCIQLAKNTGFDSSYLATLEGKIALRRGGENAALGVFKRAVELAEIDDKRKDAWPHFYLGRTLVKLDRAEEAIDVLIRGERMASERRRPHRHLLLAIRTELAIAYVYSNELPSAKRILDLLLTNEVGNAEVVWAMALYRAASGDAGDSVEIAKSAITQLDPKSARDRYGRCQVHLYRALIFMGIGNRSKASEEFSRAHYEDPRNVFVLINWACTLYELALSSRADGDPEAAQYCAAHAKSISDKVLEFNPGNERALQLLETLSDDFNIH
jgi:tetratricopeptide (TPR) repeat protein